jgi:outer membrane receptor protein involved in Fe transport
MEPARYLFPLRCSFIAVGLFAASTAFGQAAPSSATPKEDEILVLSPFVVTNQKDTGYMATDSLAGTRLRTPLKDIAASVSVVTKDFLDDVGATSTADLLVYTTGTEVVGIGGNFSGSATSTYNQEFEPQREDTSSQTRLRGLASADQTRNFFASAPHIPLDSYNTQSITINRGANAILFGFGSPAGIIENSLIAPQFLDKNRVQLRGGSYGSYRESLDFERVILKEKLSVRFAQLDDKKQYEQNATFQNQERYFGALTYKPFKLTTIRLNAEKGNIDQRLPRVDPPLDSLTTWWDFGKPTRTNLFYGKMPDGTNVTTYQRNNNLDGLPGNWAQNPGFIYANAGDTTLSDAYVAYATAPGGIVYRHLGPRGTKEIALFVPSRLDPLASFQTSKQIVDRSIFDYRKQMLEGPNSGTWTDFNTINLAVEQLFLGGDAGIEAAYDRQKSLSSVLRTESGYRGNNIYIDVDTVTPDGRPNPNFGRPYTSASGYINLDKNILETARLTAFLKHNFKGQFGQVGRLLGNQQLSGLYSEYYRDNVYMSGVNAVAAPGWASGLGGTTISDRNISTVVYLGPSLAGASSPVGAQLQGIQSQLVFPSSTPIWVENSSTGNKWVQQTVPIYQYPDYSHLMSNVSANHYKATSSAAIWQGNWWDNIFVSTLGWRNDSVRNSSSQNTAIDPVTGAVSLTPLPRVAGLTTEDSTFSYGLALHVPPKWFRQLPSGPELSLYYNRSENFQLTGVRRNVLGDYLDPQSGMTKEYGVGLSAFHNNLNFRLAWYETSQRNISDSRIAASLNKIAALESAIVGNIPKATLDAIGYVGPTSANASPTFKRYLDYYGASVGPVRSDGTQSMDYNTSPIGAADVTSSISKGIEFETIYNPTKNWRISANVAKQEARRGDTSPTFTALVNERMAQWQNPQLWPMTIGAWTVQSYAQTNLTNPLNTAKLSIGEVTPELRKWRANLVTNYSFDRGTWLKGWGFGGAVRWQDKVSIGYPVINDPVLGLVTDVHHPFMGPDEITYDSWLSYQRKIFRDKITWKIQFNVRNLFNNNLLIPVVANPVTVGDLKTRDIAAWRIGVARTWELTSTFSF